MNRAARPTSLALQLFPPINHKQVDQIPWKRYPSLNPDEKLYWWYCRVCYEPMYILQVNRYASRLIDDPYEVGGHIMLHGNAECCRYAMQICSGARL